MRRVLIFKEKGFDFEIEHKLLIEKHCFLTYVNTLDEVTQNAKKFNYELILICVNSFDDKLKNDILNTNNLTNPIPLVIFMYTYDMEIVNFYMTKGIEDCISKGNYPEILHEKLKRIQKRYFYNDVLVSGNYALEPFYNTLKYNDQEINLTQKELSILKLLIFNENNIVTKDKIATNIWNVELTKQTSKNIDASIARLKKKLPEDKISTIFGKGYIWS